MSQTQVREEACGIALPGTPADKRPLAPKSSRQADPDPGSVFVERTLKRKAAAMDAGQGRLRGKRWVRTADLHGKSRHHEWSQASGGSNSSSRSVQLPCVYVHESLVRRRCGDSRGVSLKSLTHTRHDPHETRTAPRFVSAHIRHGYGLWSSPVRVMPLSRPSQKRNRSLNVIGGPCPAQPDLLSPDTNAPAVAAKARHECYEHCRLWLTDRKPHSSGPSMEHKMKASSHAKSSLASPWLQVLDAEASATAGVGSC